MVATRQQRWEDAEQALQEGLSLARSMPYPYAEARLLHVYGSSTLTVALSLLATKARPVRASTATASSLGRWPTRTVRTTAPVRVSRTLTVLAVPAFSGWGPALTTKARPVWESTATSEGDLPTAMVRRTVPLRASSTLTLSSLL